MYDLYTCGVGARVAHYNAMNTRQEVGHSWPDTLQLVQRNQHLLYKGVYLNTGFDSHWNVGLEYRIRII